MIDLLLYCQHALVAWETKKTLVNVKITSQMLHLSNTNTMLIT